MPDAAPHPARTDAAPADPAPTDPVAPLLDEVAAAVQEQHRDLLDAVRSGIVDELQAAAAETRTQLQSANERRAERLIALDDGDAGTAVPIDAGDIVCDERQFVVEHVVTPLVERLRFVDAGVVLRGARQGLADARSSFIAALPDTLDRPEPDGLYDAEASETWVRRLRKASIRAGRIVRDRVRTAPERTQTVPIRHLARYYLVHRCPQAEAPVLADLERDLAAWVARLERAVTEWMHTALRVEAVFDRESDKKNDEHNGDAPTPEPEHDSADPKDNPDTDTPETEDAQEDTKSGTPESAPPETGTSATDGGETETQPAGDASTASPEHDRLLARLQKESRTLSNVLGDAVGLTLDDAAGRLSRRADAAQSALRDDAFRAGTFMAKTRPEDPDAAPVRDRWVDWHRQAVARLDMARHLSGIRDIIHTDQSSLAGAIVDASTAPARQIVRDTLRRLTALRDEVDILLQVPEPKAERQMVRHLDGHLEDALNLLENDCAGGLRATTVRRDTEAVVQARIDAVDHAIDEHPSTFTVHALPAEDQPPAPDAPAHTVQWHAILHETTTVLLFDGWRAMIPALADAVLRATETADDVTGIVRFNLGAAIEEVQDLRAARRRGAGDDAVTEHLDAARELALDGLDRAITLLSDAERPLVDAGLPVARAVRSTTTATWARIHERVRAAGQTREQMLRARALTESYLRTATEWGRSTMRELRIRLERSLRQGRRRGEQILRMGQTAVGTGSVDDGVLHETVAAVIGLENELRDMPLVYRRLFSLRPVRDPDLLVGRDADLQRIDQHVQQWEDGLPNALLLTGDPGSGMTSLLNVAAATSLRSARRYTIDLTERYTEERAVVHLFARTLGLTRDGLPDTFDALADQIRQHPASRRRRVVFIEHLEHLLLRAVGGTDLLATVVEFLSTTDARYIWIATISGFGWQIVRAHQPDAAGLVVEHRLAPFGRETLEELIMRRHRRSGLPLRFEAPSESPQPILTGRLARTETEEQRQTLLREEYFDRLHALCGQNVMLALFHWFRSVRLSDDGTVTIAPVQPIRFDFLDAFPIRRSFALKALLEHGSLTVSELADVMQLSTGAARTILEALGNAQLIAPIETVGVPGTYAFDGVDPAARYRVRPMVLHPVARHLRSRNIVH